MSSALSSPYGESKDRATRPRPPTTPNRAINHNRRIEHSAQTRLGRPLRFPSTFLDRTCYFWLRDNQTASFREISGGVARSSLAQRQVWLSHSTPRLFFGWQPNVMSAKSTKLTRKTVRQSMGPVHRTAPRGQGPYGRLVASGAWNDRRPCPE